MKHVELFLPDDFAEDLAKHSIEENNIILGYLERYQFLQQSQDEAGLRKVTFWYLLGTGTIILTVSLGLITTQAFGMTKLPNSAITTLIGSVAVEFVGMLVLVVRYLFTQGRKNG